MLPALFSSSSITKDRLVLFRLYPYKYKSGYATKSLIEDEERKERKVREKRSNHVTESVFVNGQFVSFSYRTRIGYTKEIHFFFISTSILVCMCSALNDFERLFGSVH